MSDQQLENLWSAIPQSIMSRKDISASSKLVYGYVDGWTRNGKDCYATNETIGEWCGIGDKTASTSVCELVKLGLVSARYDSDNTRHLFSCTPLAESARPSSRISETPLAESASNSIKDKINDTLSEDRDAELAMKSRYAPKPKRKQPAAKDPDPQNIVRPQSFIDYLAVFGVKPTDDKWIYKAWMDAIGLGATPSELVECAKAHKKASSSAQYMGNPQSFLKNGTWAKYKRPVAVSYTPQKALFPNASELVLSGASEGHLEAICSEESHYRDWWKNNQQPTRKGLIAYISQRIAKKSVDTI